MERKSLLLSWVLNIIPGVGVIYAGNKWIGVLLITIAAFLLLISLTGIGAIIGLPLYLLTSLIACVISVVYASKHNKRLSLNA